MPLENLSNIIPNSTYKFLLVISIQFPINNF